MDKVTGQAPIFKPGDVLNNTYRIEAILGRGGTSEVYRCRSEISGKVVALKVLRSEFAGNADYLALMTREENVRDIHHDTIVHYYDTQRTPDGTVYLVMDFVDGPSLDAKMRAGGMSAEALLTVAGRVLEGLAAAHGRNIIHRDLSPDNIILRGDDPAKATIIDFGIAKDSNPGAETIVGGEFAGKYAFAAPEQLAGKADPRTDLYALGALLLAIFRGRSPDSGANLMEVVNRKAQPLDMSGVPQPLGELIDRLSAPAPEARFQSAEAALAFLRTASAPADATVIVPRKVTPPAPARVASAPKPAPTEPGSPASGGPKRRTALIAAALALLVVALGAVEFATGTLGIFTPRLPWAKPFTLQISRVDGAGPVAEGFVPSPETAQLLGAALAAQGGMPPTLTVARGDLAEGWGQGVVQLVQTLADLPEYRLSVSDNQVTANGLTNIRADYDRLKTELVAMPTGLTGTAQLELGPRILSPQTVISILRAHEDCGRLTVADAPSTGWGAGANLHVTGRVAHAETQAALRDALTEAIGNRVAQLDLEVLNPTLCLMDANTPSAEPAGLVFTFGYGDRPDPNPKAQYVVGDNPVIDLTLPADLKDGYLYVSVLDVSGNVFHLLPNVNRQENRIRDLGDGPLRLSYGLEQAKGSDRLAFTVDGSSLGKTRLIALISDQPLFDSLRPITESAESYAKALQEVSVPVRSLDSAILTTSKP
ncbi:protein kinase [Paracoccus sp. CPCC 101403]|uniref:Protein kinase n=1 Tax=Paracoccus broussonetiae TaxID=3075834 RepID=A0ABU3EDK7_9RHOB|nr:protein kinase [Paracoccus sp. CPCC 101403]MDT1062323.1 protein kinase [Paracoccus sp. CPCC 101403]